MTRALGFDGVRSLAEQSEAILERSKLSGNIVYLELGDKTRLRRRGVNVTSDPDFSSLALFAS
jgi:uncharacterized protein (UPF0371 family)